VKLSIVIATKDRADYLEHALASLERQAGAPQFEAIVVDNGSTDATPAVVRSAVARGVLDLRRVYVAEPNRGAARNAGVAIASGDVVLFVDDDVVLPKDFLAAHARAHEGATGAAVSGPIMNVPGYEARPKPTLLNYSAAFFCTCNVSVSRAALLDVGVFDEGFDLYGWEDTELGLRLRRHGVRRAFAWDAYLWHIKPPRVETLQSVHAKTVERAHMAARFLGKDRSLRTKLATGAYGVNFVRSALFAPPPSLEGYRRIASSERVPGFVRAFARAQFLDGSYTAALRGALAERES
jgi:GT2 family glycosyltransferase